MIADIQAGLGKALSAVPLFLFTAKELTMKGTVKHSEWLPAQLTQN